MYVAVATAVLGQALLFGNWRLLLYVGLVCVLFHIFVILYEEPKLRTTFGGEYENYCAQVRRWIPHLTRWEGGLRK